MNATVRTFALIGYTLPLAADLSQAKNDRVAWRAKHLLKAAHNAANRYPSSDLNKSNLKAISKAIKRLNSYGLMAGKAPKLTPILSMILCGCDDVLQHTKNPVTVELFQELESKLMWLNDLVDPRGDQWADYIRGEWVYEEWTGQRQAKVEVEHGTILYFNSKSLLVDMREAA